MSGSRFEGSSSEISDGHSSTTEALMKMLCGMGEIDVAALDLHGGGVPEKAPSVPHQVVADASLEYCPPVSNDGQPTYASQIPKSANYFRL